MGLSSAVATASAGAIPLASAVSTRSGAKGLMRSASAAPSAAIKAGSTRWLRKWSIFGMRSSITVASATMRWTSGAKGASIATVGGGLIGAPRA